MKRFIVRCLALLMALPVMAQVSVNEAGGRITVEVEGKPFTELILKGEGVMKPYYYPIYSATGKVITRHYPMKKDVPGESADHPHHRGLSFTHGDVNGLDFWSADPSREGGGFGTVEFREASEIKSGDKQGSFKTAFDWKDGNGEVVLTEERTTTVYSVGIPLRIMDVDIVLTGVQTAHFGGAKEGSFAIRVADSMNELHGGTLVNAQGVTGEEQAWGKSSPFMDYYGEVEGEQLGVAFFDHPSNPGHPAYWHVRSYGLFAANIFGERGFFRDKSRGGGLTLEAGDTWRFRYRVMIHSGTPESANVDKHYANWAGGKYLAMFRKTGRCLSPDERAIKMDLERQGKEYKK